VGLPSLPGAADPADSVAGIPFPQTLSYAAAVLPQPAPQLMAEPAPKLLLQALAKKTRPVFRLLIAGGGRTPPASTAAAWGAFFQAAYGMKLRKISRAPSGYGKTVARANLEMATLCSHTTSQPFSHSHLATRQPPALHHSPQTVALVRTRQHGFALLA